MPITPLRRGSGDLTVSGAVSSTQASYAASGGSGSSVLENVTVNSAVNVGDVVRFDGSEYNTASASVESTSRVVGIVVSKSDSTTANIATAGTTGTVMSGLTANTRYFLSTTSGALTNVPPSGSGNIVLEVGIASATNELIIHLGQAMVRD